MDGDASFGHWLRRRRKALRLSAVDLAHRVGCATVTLHKIEADERRPSQQIAAKLAEYLAVAPHERSTFIKVARGELGVHQLALAEQLADRPALAASAPLRTKLPSPTTPLIGRAQEVAAVRDYLTRADVRLLTLIGAPGIGKTRLSLQVATELRDTFADGVCFIPLAPIRDPELVLATIAQALEITELPGQPVLGRLQTALRDRHMLLVLDNFEQVLKAALPLGELLAAAAQLTLLVTSRVALRLSGEQRFTVPPLALPPPTILEEEGGLEREWEARTQYAAMQLFVTRARTVMPTFALTATNAAAVAAICRRLDGLPLAIELAATRIALFTPQELLAHLDQRLVFLTKGAVDLPTRQQTLRHAIDWSYELLDVGEQTLFRRLGVFVGGCTLEAARSVCDTVDDLGIEVLEGVTALLDKSLIQRLEGADGQSRFTMLETIREYALERLEQSGETEVLRRQHAAYYLAVAETTRLALEGPEQAAWLRRLEIEHDNLRAALQWALDQNAAELGARISGSLWKFWEIRGHLSEGRRWLERILVESEAMSVAARATALHGAANLASAQGDNVQALALGAEALALFRALGDSGGSAWVLTYMGFASRQRGVDMQATAQFTEGLSLFRNLGYIGGIAVCLEGLGRIAQSQGQLERAETLVAESLALRRDLGNKTDIAWVLNALGGVAVDQGKFGQATALFEESLTLFRELGHKRGISGELNHLGEVALLQSTFEQAAVLIEEGLALARSLGDKSGIAFALNLLGRLASMQGDHDRATLLQKESMAIGREIGNPWDNAMGLHHLGHVTLSRGDWACAAALFAESLAIYRDLGKTNFLAYSLTGFAGVAGAQGQPERAAKLLGAAHQLLAATGARLHPFDLQDLDRTLSSVHSQLDEAIFATAWDEGRAMALEQAVAYALEVGAADATEVVSVASSTQ